MTLEDFKNLTAGIQSLATFGAFVAGGYWTYLRFIKQREDYPFIEFSVDINFVGKQDGAWIVELIAYLENKGKVQHRFCDLSFSLEALYVDDPVRPNEKYGGQAYFPHELAKRPWLPKAEYFLEPGVKGKYSYVAQVPEQASFVLLHGRFTYQNQTSWHTAEKTVKVPVEINSQGTGSHAE